MPHNCLTISIHLTIAYSTCVSTLRVVMEMITHDQYGEDTIASSHNSILIVFHHFTYHYHHLQRVLVLHTHLLPSMAASFGEASGSTPFSFITRRHDVCHCTDASFVVAHSATTVNEHLRQQNYAKRRRNKSKIEDTALQQETVESWHGANRTRPDPPTVYRPAAGREVN